MPEGVAERRRRGKDHRPPDDDRRARRHRRHPGRRPQLRRRDQHPGDHRPALPVRLLRRRRARPRLPRPRAGGPRGQPQRVQVRAAARGRRRLHQHQPVAKSVVFVGTFTAGQPHRRRARRPAHDPRGGRRAQVRARGRAPHLLGQAGVEAPAARALRHRALRVPAVRGRARARRGRARHRHRARHPRADGLPAGDQRHAEADGRRDLPRRADGPARASARDPAGAPLHLRPRAEHPLHQLRATVDPHAGRTSRTCASRSSGSSSKPAARSTRSSTTTTSTSRRSSSTRGPTWSGRWSSATTGASRATRPPTSRGCGSATRWPSAASFPASTSSAEEAHVHLAESGPKGA